MSAIFGQETLRSALLRMLFFFFPPPALNGALQLKMMHGVWRMHKQPFEMHKQQAMIKKTKQKKNLCIDHSGDNPGSRLCAGLFSNSRSLIA